MKISPYVYPDLAGQERFRVLVGRLNYEIGLLVFIEDLVTSFFGETIEGIKKRTKYRNKVLCRNVCFYMMRKKTGLTHSQISDRFNQHNHTCVVHGLQSLSDLMDSDPKIKEAVQMLERKIEQRN